MQIENLTQLATVLSIVLGLSTGLFILMVFRGKDLLYDAKYRRYWGWMLIIGGNLIFFVGMGFFFTVCFAIASGEVSLYGFIVSGGTGVLITTYAVQRAEAKQFKT